jgi:hypothetical protein
VVGGGQGGGQDHIGKNRDHCSLGNP